MATKNMKQDLIPFLAGKVVFIPLDDLGNDITAEMVSTNREYLLTTQVTRSSASETVANGNGQDGEFPLDETYTFVYTTNVYEPKVHAVLSGATVAEKADPILEDGTFTPTATGGPEAPKTSEYTFPEDKAPINGTDGKVRLVVKDGYGNVFADVSGTETALADANFKFDADTRKITLDPKYVGQLLYCEYFYEDAEAITYEAPKTPKLRNFRIIARGEVMSAGSKTVETCVQELARVAVSGDLPDLKTQKQKQNTLTYTFKTQPVPKGVVPYKKTFAPYKE